MDGNLDKAKQDIHAFLDEQEERAKQWGESPLKQSRLVVAGLVVLLVLVAYVAGCVHGEKEAAAAPAAAVEAVR